MNNWNWLIENWYFVYFPIHLVSGALSWGWFNYGTTKFLEEKFGVTLKPDAAALVGLFMGFVSGPILTLVVVFYCFFPDGIWSRRGLRFL